MNVGDVLDFALHNGEVRRFELLGTGAEVLETNVDLPGPGGPSGHTNYRFTCRLRIDGQEVELEREVSTQRSFYEPWEFDGLQVWFDAVDDIFDFLSEDHGPCRPGKQARFGIHDASLAICPVKLHAWCPLPEGGLRIEDCYNGEDCWLGAYQGVAAHGGLDINHPRGTPLFAPIDIEDHYYFESLEKGHNNNRWRGHARWPDGSEWILQAHHMSELLVPEHEPIPAGTHYAVGAGVLLGDHPHSHFVFKTVEDGGEVMLDPWILFHQMYRDRGAREYLT
jgi:hypothetical protein